MDFSKLKVYDWLMIGGGAAMLILGFVLPWSSVDTGFGSDSGDGPFDYFFTGGIAWLLVVTVGVLALLRVLGTLPDNQPWPLIFLGATGLATLLMLLRIILGGRTIDTPVGGFEVDRGVGMFGALIWSILALAGAYLLFQDSGGELSDLTDMDKLKNEFGGGDGGQTDMGQQPPPPPTSHASGQPAPPPQQQQPPPPTTQTAPQQQQPPPPTTQTAPQQQQPPPPPPPPPPSQE